MRGFSLDSLFLSLNTSWQNLFVANPSVAKVIFLSNSKDTSLSDNDDAIVLFDVDVDEGVVQQQPCLICLCKKID